MKRLVFGLVLIATLFACKDSKKKKDPPRMKDFFNQELFDQLPSDSLKRIVKGIYDTDIVGKPLGEFLEKWNPKKYRIDNVSYTNSESQYCSGIVFHRPEGLQIDVGLKDKINVKEHSMWNINMGDATELKDKRVAFYLVFYKGTFEESQARLKQERDSIRKLMVGNDTFMAKKVFTEDVVSDSALYKYNLSPGLKEDRLLIYKEEQ